MTEKLPAHYQLLPLERASRPVQELLGRALNGFLTNLPTSTIDELRARQEFNRELILTVESALNRDRVIANYVFNHHDRIREDRERHREELEQSRHERRMKRNQRLHEEELDELKRERELQQAQSAALGAALNVENLSGRLGRNERVSQAVLELLEASIKTAQANDMSEEYRSALKDFRSQLSAHGQAER